ncbi:hypothetical protein BO78DRAFT_11547 [Aspergillus sclerotiicarbonarius CBS 121057]|uniref:Uncharacterized protein n=1 Tax=Aspergillus sclerotiicarbonarius (strain CBS 121057 / IBT 28362) TaxID=1448318 RepID=A0A319EYE2_ASPSB|nr:hypothetical protein BO78DRAFT_11547 [Aspergillus sclerotiicarbonarius CBS 121057]
MDPCGIRPTVKFVLGSGVGGSLGPTRYQVFVRCLGLCMLSGGVDMDPCGVRPIVKFVVGFGFGCIIGTNPILRVDGDCGICLPPYFDESMRYHSSEDEHMDDIDNEEGAWEERMTRCVHATALAESCGRNPWGNGCGGSRKG